MRTTNLVAILVAVVFAASAATSACAEDYRIESRIYIGEETTPACRNLSLFQRHIVYDFLEGSTGETTIYEPQNGTFTLLDPQRKVKTTFDRKTLADFVAQIAVLAERKDALYREAAKPKFQVTFDERLQQVDLKGNLIHYVAQGQPFSDSEFASQYREFVDMYARLNATQPSSLPPLARLELNAALAGRGLCPTMVERKIRTRGPLSSEESIVRSEHTIAKRILESDQKRIDIASRQRAEFELVDFGSYRNLEER